MAARGLDIGEPLGEAIGLGGGWRVQGFASGVLYREPDLSVWAIVNPIYDRWLDFQTATERPENLGFPIADQTSDDPATAAQHFEHGWIQCAPSGCFHLWGEIRRQWSRYREALGPPIGEIRVNLPSFASTGTFEHGTVIVDVQNRSTVCGNDGSTIKPGPTICGPGTVLP